jgi:tetratricopeptide (TPR) repeat protein
VRDLLEGGRHVQLGSADAKLQALQTTLGSDPGSLSNYLALARGYAVSAEYAAARDVLEQACDGASPAYRALLFAAGSARSSLPPPDRENELLAPEAPDSPAAVTVRWLESLLEMSQGRFASSARGLSRVRGLEPDNAGLGLHLGLAQLGLRQYDAAISTLEEVVEGQPSHIAARIALAAIYINYDRLALARDHLEAVMAVDPEHALAAYFLGRAQLRLRRPMDAAAAFRSALAVKPEDLNAWFHLARAYRSGGFYGAAVDTYDEIIRRQPALFDAHRDRARLYKFLSDKVAMTHKRESEKARPVGIGAGEWQQYLSQLEQRSREYGELALVGFDRAQDLRPLDAGGMRQIGEIFRRAGQLGKARKQFEWLARSEPSRWLHRYRLGTIAIRQGEHADAIAFLEGALELAPAEGDVYVALAFAYSRAGRVDDAIATLERGAVYEAFNPALYTNLGAAYAARGDYGPARKSLERAVRLRTFPLPRTHLAYTNLGIIHWRQGRRADAIQALEKALHVFPEYAYAKRLLADLTSGDARAKSGGTSNATFVYDDLLERFGETSTVQFANE